VPLSETTGAIHTEPVADAEVAPAPGARVG